MAARSPAAGCAASRGPRTTATRWLARPRRWPRSERTAHCVKGRRRVAWPRKCKPLLTLWRSSVPRPPRGHDPRDSSASKRRRPAAHLSCSRTTAARRTKPAGHEQRPRGSLSRVWRTRLPAPGERRVGGRAACGRAGVPASGPRPTTWSRQDRREACLTLRKPRFLPAYDRESRTSFPAAPRASTCPSSAPPARARSAPAANSASDARSRISIPLERRHLRRARADTYARRGRCSGEAVGTAEEQRRGLRHVQGFHSSPGSAAPAPSSV